MSENFLDTLTADEAEQLRQDIEAAKQKVLARRQDAKIAGLTENYKRDMLAARGNPSALRRIKERYRAQGTPVDEIDFTDMV